MSSNHKSWSNLVGKPADEAVEAIKKEDSNLHVIKLEDGSPVTTDERHDRVRVFHDENGNVVSEPKIA
ncbi:unnamed protein product [Adineta steineri]|uniref:Uncharacterized protein n=1 Tax=Adineta steineri TaxID=433720 RepID=A0A815RNQ6_9BILA|nr:unnamed protein product [Adineta steineri]CAF1478881.1 unnamed protein product [Adineta steineri]